MSEGPEFLRLARGAMAATLATGVALLGHVLGGGDVPTALGVAVPWWLSVTLATVLASRSSLPRLGAAVLGSQALFHLLFVIGTPGNPAVTFSDAPGMHVNHGPEAAAISPAAAGPAQHLAHSAHLTGPMMLGHLLAAVATVAVLHRGEGALMRAVLLVAGFAHTLGRALFPPTASPSFLLLRLRPTWQDIHLPHPRLLDLRPLAIRGPPSVPAS